MLNRIISEAHVVSQGVTEITKATEAQAEATNRVMQGMEQTNTLTRQNRQRMEDMAALAEETSASTEEIASASAELSQWQNDSKLRPKSSRYGEAMAATIDVVEFELGGERYALDINLAREIVEMIPITPIPRAPPLSPGSSTSGGDH